MNPKIKHFLLLGLLILLSIPPRLWAQSPNQAALVIRYGDGQVETRCLAFTEPQITGYDVLVRSGLDVTIDASGMGAAVCAIQGTGCPANDCFCHCQGAECQYWSYWHQVNGVWQYSLGGAGIYPVANGAVEGWSWGPGSVTEAIAPPVVSFDAVCNAPSASPTATLPPPTATPAPQVNFWAEAMAVNAGTCTVLHWQAEYVTAVYLDGAGVEGQGARQVCPAQTETYTLRITHPGGELQRQVSVIVQPLPATSSPAPALTPTASATSAPLLPTSPPTRLPLTAVVTAAATAAGAIAPPPAPVAAPADLSPTPSPPPMTLAATAVIAFAIPTATTMAAPPAAATPATTAALAPVTPMSTLVAPAAAPGSLLNYVIFGLIFVGLGGALALWSKRRLS